MIRKRNLFTIVKAPNVALRLSLGKFDNIVRKPGLYLNIPVYHRMELVDLREKINKISSQSLISKDNVTFYVNGVVQYKIVDPVKSCFNVDGLDKAIDNKSSIILKNCLSGLEINEILNKREKLNISMLENFAQTEKDWGIKVININIKDISFDSSMTRAMSVKAEADRNAEAKIINARADFETAKIYSDISKIYKENPISLRLREYQLWQSVSKNPASTIYVVPSNITDLLKQK